ncbi:type II secretion system F family protein [Salirhabdus salicampi]|uniref:type II secretion system F family protein n=1 Tax=Salirhabdus salicampi TaxID=476102 RepID=UPI0020C59281|nr:type II secretion system F family protein [Salirhabdus salicampi]MCP8616137.1 type II secretion system F family protein [Salirhabdus salicampi]
MLDVTLWVIAFFFFTLSIGLLQLKLSEKRLKIEERIAPLIQEQSEKAIETKEENENHSFKARVVQPLFTKTRTFLLKRMPKEKVKDVERRLREAGHPFGLKGIDFFVAQLVVATFFALFLFLVSLKGSDNMMSPLFLSVFTFFFILFYTNFYVNSKRKQRIALIERSMPDFFDMVNISIEAGLGLDGALRRVSKQMGGPLADEFQFTIEDMALGKTRRQAFTELRERVASDFFKSVISALIQADTMGISISKVLRSQTQRIREQQRQRVKEQAMKAPVKMMIPMVLFIFPSLFIVLLGPALIQFMTMWN